MFPSVSSVNAAQVKLLMVVGSVATSTEITPEDQVPPEMVPW